MNIDRKQEDRRKKDGLDDDDANKTFGKTVPRDRGRRGCGVGDSVNPYNRTGEVSDLKMTVLCIYCVCLGVKSTVRVAGLSLDSLLGREEGRAKGDASKGK